MKLSEELKRRIVRPGMLLHFAYHAGSDHVAILNDVAIECYQSGDSDHNRQFRALIDPANGYKLVEPRAKFRSVDEILEEIKEETSTTMAQWAAENEAIQGPVFMESVGWVAEWAPLSMSEELKLRRAQVGDTLRYKTDDGMFPVLLQGGLLDLYLSGRYDSSETFICLWDKDTNLPKERVKPRKYTAGEIQYAIQQKTQDSCAWYTALAAGWEVADRLPNCNDEAIVVALYKKVGDKLEEVNIENLVEGKCEK